VFGAFGLERFIGNKMANYNKVNAELVENRMCNNIRNLSQILQVVLNSLVMFELCEKATRQILPNLLEAVAYLNSPFIDC